MSFNKCRSLRVSERVFDLVVEQLEIAVENDVKIDGWLETFYNCREQGLLLHIHSVDHDNPNRTKKVLWIWCCENRNSDNIMVIVSSERQFDNTYNEEEYNNRKLFESNQLTESAQYIVKKVEETFESEYRNYRGQK